MQLNEMGQHTGFLAGKTVIVRANFDVPIEKGQVLDTTRIEDSINTISILRSHGCRVILLSHYDRPDGVYDPDKSLQAVVPELESRLNQPVTFVPYTNSYQNFMPEAANLVLMDNLRFYPEEEANDKAFAAHLASFGEVYINEAFANCHRAHASIVGITQHLPGYAGVSLTQEMAVLTQVTQTPKRPLVVVIGGAKLETKEPLVNAFLSVADTILVGGKVALDMKTKGSTISDKIVLADLIPNGKDITSDSARRFADSIMQAGTVIWNGSLGVFEEEACREGTTIVAKAINTTSAFTVIGGGDTEAALTTLELQAGIDYISTGGGAMLTYLSEGTLVGLEPLRQAA
jgi:phosphoglycerate kinase